MKTNSLNKSLDGFCPQRPQNSGFSSGSLSRTVSYSRRPISDEYRRSAVTQNTNVSTQLSAPLSKEPVETPQPTSQKFDELTPDLNFILPVYEAPQRPSRLVRKKASFMKGAVRTMSMAIVAVLVTGGFFAWKGYGSLNSVLNGTTTVAALSHNVAPELLKGEGDGRVNILLMGVGGGNHDGADLTDTMVVLSIDPVNRTGVMLSIPRDLWVKMPVAYFGDKQKINAAYSSGKYQYLGKMDSSNSNAEAVNAGFDSVDKVVGQVLGININYHVLVNFQAFKQAVDTVNGVDINVTEALVDPTMAWENGNNPTLAALGLQKMDGRKALMYARSRYTTSDFSRGERQRQLLLALKTKATSAGVVSNPAKISGLMNSFSNNVYSDLSPQAASRLLTIMKKVSDNSIQSVDMTSDANKLIIPGKIGEISVVQPVAGLDNYSQIQSFVRASLHDGYILKEKAPIHVVSSTAQSAEKVATNLKEYGYIINGTQTSNQILTRSLVVDLSGGKSRYTKHYLEDRYHVTAETSLPPGINAPVGTKFVIIVP